MRQRARVCEGGVKPQRVKVAGWVVVAWRVEDEAILTITWPYVDFTPTPTTFRHAVEACATGAAECWECGAGNNDDRRRGMVESCPNRQSGMLRLTWVANRR